MTESTPFDPASVFIIVPAYNESPVIQGVLRPLIAAGFSVVVVDDGSQDDTWVQLGTLAVHRLKHPLNLGQGAALQTGMSYALLQGAQHLIHYDADGQHSPEDILGLLQPVIDGEADVVLGSRFLRREDWLAVPSARRVLLKGAVVVNGLLTGLWLSDAHNGARALSRHAAEQITLRENSFAHASEILQQIKAKRLRFVERPTRIRYTEYSQFKGQKTSNAINILLDLVIQRFFR